MDDAIASLPGVAGAAAAALSSWKGARKAAQRQQQPTDAEDPFTSNYGDVPIEEIQSTAISGRSWTKIGDLDDSATGCSMLTRGATQVVCPINKKMGVRPEMELR